MQLRPAYPPANMAEAKKALKKALLGLSLRFELFAAPGMAMKYVILETANGATLRGEGQPDVDFELSRMIETAATDGHRVMINPDFFMTLDDEERIGLCAHENMHVGLGHPWRMGTRQPKAWNIATDIGMNEYLKEAGIKIPKGGLTADLVIPMLVKAGCPRSVANTVRTASSETVYDILMQYLATKLPDGADGHVVAPPSGDNPQEKVAENVERLQAAVERVEKQNEERKTNRGVIPGGLKVYLQRAQKNLVDWKTATWKFVQGSIPSDYSYRRTNRRFVDDGLFMPVVDRIGVGPVAVMLDTSGSVGDDHLKAFMGEIQAIVDAVRPEWVIVIPCDSRVDVDAVEVLQPGEEFDERKIGNRGGTSFIPPFEYLEENNIQVDKIIYLTDMDGPFPEDPGVPTLWVSTQRDRNTAPFGDVVVVDIT